MNNAVGRSEQVWGQFRKVSAAEFDQLAAFRAYAANRSNALRNQLVQLNDGLAKDAAHRWKEFCAVPYDDLCQVARIGLIKAVEKFEPMQGNAFSSFAVPYIQGEVQHFLRDYSWDLGKVPRRAIESASRVKRIQRRAIAAGRLETSEQQAAQSIGMSGALWRQVAEVTARKPVLTLSEALHVAAEHDEAVQLHQNVRGEVARLPNPYRRAILERYFKGSSEAAIAQQQQVAVAQVVIWLAEGLRRLQAGHLGNARVG